MRKATITFLCLVASVAALASEEGKKEAAKALELNPGDPRENCCKAASSWAWMRLRPPDLWDDRPRAQRTCNCTPRF